MSENKDPSRHKGFSKIAKVAGVVVAAAAFLAALNQILGEFNRPFSFISRNRECHEMNEVAHI